MVDWRALVAATLTALSVFTFFALPLLRQLYGPEVLLGFYAIVSLALGATVYLTVSRIFQRFSARRSTDSKQPNTKEESESEVNEEDVRTELETLKQQEEVEENT